MRRLIRDESGIAMGLAVILIVVIGVMGAGLLVFVRNDLEAVVEVNQGQRAFEMADAGVKAAEQRLDSGESVDGTQWSASAPNGTGACQNLGPEEDLNGVCLTDLYDSGTENAVNVQIESDDNSFTVTSTGEYRAAKRRIEAVYEPEGDGIPEAYFAARDVEIGGDDVRIRDASIFAGRNILGLRSDTLEGEDEAYADWRVPPWNTTARGSTESGAGATGEIDYESGRSSRYEEHDSDSLSNPEFIRKSEGGAQEDDEISFPFDPGSVDDELVESLCETASQQENYYTPNGDNFAIDEDYPDDSDQSTVFCVEFTGDKGSVDFESDDRQGTLVVVNGDLNTGSLAENFKGVLVVDDPDPGDNTVPVYRSTGNFSLEGYANVEGDMQLDGDTSLAGSTEVESSSGSYGVELRSWRELYE